MFAPNAKAAQDEIEGQIRQANREAHPDDEETAEELDAIEQVLEDPEIKKEVTELLMKKLSEN